MLPRTSRCHPVTAVIEEQAGERSVRALLARIVLDSIIREQLLNGVKGWPLDDRFVLAFVDGALVGDFADVESVLQEVLEGA